MARPEEALLSRLQGWIPNFMDTLLAPDGRWNARGIIDERKQLYPLSGDTKLISKVIEVMLESDLQNFAEHFGYRMESALHQNYYPDVTIRDEYDNFFALDIKTAYREGANTVSGMTLGTFTGYFRERDKKKNIAYPYSWYKAHLVLGVIYSRVVGASSLRKYTLDEMDRLPVLLKDIVIFVQPKYRIARDRPGSGNTRNIGAVKEIDALVNGRGPFAEYGEDLFDRYWMGYFTADMARSAGLQKPPYTSLEEYLQLQQRGGE
ncbi:MAG: type II restriction endonuclease [Fimbriimonadales bacterium]